MALFGFGNKEKKIKDANNANKQKIMMLIQNVQMNSKSPDVSSVLRNLQNQLASQGDTSKEEVMGIDNEIIKLLTEANTFILKEQYPTAISKLNRAYNLSIDRQQYCIVGGQMTKQDKRAAEASAKLMSNVVANTKKDRSEELQSQIDEANAEYDALSREFEQLRTLYAANPNNRSIAARAQMIKQKMTATQTRINNLTTELNKELNDALLADMAKQNDELVMNRTYSESESQVNRAKIMAQNAERNATQADIAAGMDLLGQSGSLNFDPFAEDAGQTASIFNPFEDTFGSTATAATAAPVKQPAKAQQQQTYGSFDASSVGSTEMARDLSKTIAKMQDAIDDYQDKIDDANEDYKELNSQLAALLKRRATATPSDCMVLDGQIDQLNSKRNNVVNKIKRYRQVVATMNDKMSLLDKLSTQQDLTASSAAIEALTSGKFSDFEGLAMFLNESVKQSNEQLQEIGTAVSVSEGEDILVNSASGASAVLTDSMTEKDEDRYAALERELGLRRN